MKGMFSSKGKVVAVVPAASKIVIKHEEIKGFMKGMPMGMGYGVASKDLLKKVKPGDPVHFTIDASVKKIVKIEVMK